MDEHEARNGVKADLHRALQDNRAGLLSRLDGLDEVDLRRPLTQSGTNLLGLVKHLAGIEYGYLGDSFGRPPAQALPWVADGSIWDGADMWATAEESSDDIVALYRAACEHGDRTIDELDLDTPGRVPWWDEDKRVTTLGTLLVRMVAETSRHAGHADIVRELIDGRAGKDHDAQGDREWWSRYVAGIEEAAKAFENPRD